MTRAEAERLVRQFEDEVWCSVDRGRDTNVAKYRAALLAALATESAPTERFRLEGKGVIDLEGGLSLCTGCGKLPPHAGCQAICAACEPPTGACYCAGCTVAGKGAPPPPDPTPVAADDAPPKEAAGDEDDLDDDQLCPACDGEGANEGWTCPACKGDGLAPSGSSGEGAP